MEIAGPRPDLGIDYRRCRRACTPGPGSSQRRLDAGDWIPLRRRCERKVIGRVAVILDDAEMPCRHRKTVVETSLACSGDMHEGGVKHGPASLVDVHARSSI